MEDKEIRKIYEKEIKKVESRIARIFKKRNPRSLYLPAEYILASGGKRIRPFLVLASAKAVGADFSRVYNAAVAVELLHNFTLVHDDIMDNADKRRNMMTLHKKFDLGTAILTGDSLTAYAYKYLIKDAKDKIAEVISLFTDGVIEVCEGQSFDGEFEHRNDVAIDEYMNMIKKKTAALLEMCCAIGGVLGGGSEEEIRHLRNYGKNLGIAFQLRDDLLDIAADEKEFGKKIGGDLVEGKKTFLLLKSLELAKGKEKKLLMQVIRKNGIEREKVLEYKALYERLGVFEIVEKEISKYTKRALKSLEALKNDEGKELLDWIARELLERKK
jgi:geranylgeranyl diphosphate synthase type II